MKKNDLKTINIEPPSRGAVVVSCSVMAIAVIAICLLLGMASWWFCVVVVMGVFVTATVISKPEYCLYILTFCMIPSTILGFSFGEINMKSAYLVAAIVLLSWIIARLVNTRQSRPETECDGAFLFFGYWALLSLLWSQDRITGYEDAIKLFLDIAIVFLMVAIIRKKKILTTVLGLFILMGVIDALLTLWYPYTSYYLVRSWDYAGFIEVVLKFWIKNAWVPEGRGMGFFTAHGTAVTLSIAVTFASMLFYVTRSKGKRVVLFTIAFLMFAALICTLTKSVIISSMCGILYACFYLKPFRRRFVATAILLVVLVGGSFVLTRIQDLGTATSMVGQNLRVSVDNPDEETSTGSRVVLFKIGFEKLIETAGFGTGIGGFLQYSPYKQMDGSHPAVLFDLGFIGFGLWAWILLGAFNLFIKTMRKCKSEYYKRMILVYLGGYVNILISWVVTFSYADIYIWFYLGIGLALVCLAKDASPQADGQLPFSDKDGESLVVY